MTLVRSRTGIVASRSMAPREKPRAKRRDIEGPVQAAIIEAIELAVRHVDVRAVPNATGWLKKAQRGKLARDGRKAGTLDLLIAWCGSDAAGMAVMEIKPPGYTPSMVSTDQRELIAKWGSWGLNVGIASTPEEALALMTAWGAPVRASVSA